MQRARKAIEEARRLRQDFRRSSTTADTWNVRLLNRVAVGDMPADALVVDAVPTDGSAEAPPADAPADGAPCPPAPSDDGDA